MCDIYYYDLKYNFKKKFNGHRKEEYPFQCIPAILYINTVIQTPLPSMIIGFEDMDIYSDTYITY